MMWMDADAPAQGANGPPSPAGRRRRRPGRREYLAAVRHFAGWCELRGLALDQVEPMVVAAYVEEHPGAVARDRQAAPRGAPDALRLARRRPGPPLQPRELGPGAPACRQSRQDPDPLRQGDPGPPRRHRRLDPGGPSRPRLPRRVRLQLPAAPGRMDTHLPPLRRRRPYRRRASPRLHRSQIELSNCRLPPCYSTKDISRYRGTAT